MHAAKIGHGSQEAMDLECAEHHLNFYRTVSHDWRKSVGVVLAQAARQMPSVENVLRE